MERIDFKTGTFYQGDCFEVLATLSAGSVDMILNDPPYGTTQNKWDSVLPLPGMWAAYWRVLKANGPAVMTAVQPFTSVLGASCIDALRYEWIWKKPHTGQLNARRMPLKNTENCLVFYRDQPTYNPQFSEGKPYTVKRKGYSGNESYGAQRDHDTISDGRRHPMQVLEFSERGNGSWHPTQKPVALFEYLIRTYTNPGELVLDPTAGSGTTAVAAIQAGRRWICVERDPEYFFKACARVYEAEAAL